MSEFIKGQYDQGPSDNPFIEIDTEVGPVSLNPGTARLISYVDFPEASNIEYETGDENILGGILVSEVPPDDVFRLIDNGMEIEEVEGPPSDDDSEVHDIVFLRRMEIARHTFDEIRPDYDSESLYVPEEWTAKPGSTSTEIVLRSDYAYRDMSQALAAKGLHVFMIWQRIGE